MAALIQTSYYTDDSAITDGDFFIIRVTAADTTTIKYYKVVVSVDNSAPTFSAAFTVNNATQPNIILVVASEAIAADAANTPANWVVTNNGGSITYTIACAALQGDAMHVLLTLAAVDSADNQTYITTAAGAADIKITPNVAINDLAGNAYAGGIVTRAGGAQNYDAISAAVSGALAATSATTVTVSFNEKVDKTTAETVANYAISGSSAVGLAGGSPSAAVLQANGMDVLLTVADYSRELH